MSTIINFVVVWLPVCAKPTFPRYMGCPIYSTEHMLLIFTWHCLQVGKKIFRVFIWQPLWSVLELDEKDYRKDTITPFHRLSRDNIIELLLVCTSQIRIGREDTTYRVAFKAGIDATALVKE